MRVRQVYAYGVGFGAVRPTLHPPPPSAHARPAGPQCPTPQKPQTPPCTPLAARDPKPHLAHPWPPKTRKPQTPPGTTLAAQDPENPEPRLAQPWPPKTRKPRTPPGTTLAAQDPENPENPTLHTPGSPPHMPCPVPHCTLQPLQYLEPASSPSHGNLAPAGSRDTAARALPLTMRPSGEKMIRQGIPAT